MVKFNYSVDDLGMIDSVTLLPFDENKPYHEMEEEEFELLRQAMRNNYKDKLLKINPKLEFLFKEGKQ